MYLPKGFKMHSKDWQIFMDRAPFYDVDMQEWVRLGEEVKPVSNQIGSRKYHMVMSYHPLDGETYHIRAAMPLCT